MTTSSPITTTTLETMQISRIVEVYPETMSVFSHYGLDMCCGGSHTVSDAARLHEIKQDELTGALLDTINRERR